MVIYSKVTEAPGHEPVSLDEARSQLNMDPGFTDHDTMIELMITVSRRLCEAYAGLSLVTQERTIKLDRFPCGSSILNENRFYRRTRHDGIIVPYGPLQNVDEITYFDESGNEQTLAPSAYHVDDHSDLGRIYPVDSWPATDDRPNAVTVVYTAGHDWVSGIAPPTEAKQAILQQLASLYENRQDESTVKTYELCLNSKRILDPIKVYWNAEQD